MGAPADPGTTSFVPRPDWYFYFLFYLLRIFKWPESVFLGTVGVPNICSRPPDHAAVHGPAADAEDLAAAGRDGRRRARHPLDGHPDVEGRDCEGGARVGDHQGRPELDQDRAPPAGSRAGREALRPRGLHRVPHVQRRRRLEPRRARSDQYRLEESRRRGSRSAHLTCPSCVNPGSPMPPFKSLGPKALQQLAIFLEASKGTK